MVIVSWTVHLPRLAGGLGKMPKLAGCCGKKERGEECTQNKIINNRNMKEDII